VYLFTVWDEWLNAVKPFVRRLKTFSGALWACSIAAALFIVCTPLIQNLWAYYTWERVPCWGKPERFFFSYGESNYYCGRRDFWVSPILRAELSIPGNSHPEPTTICYVRPGHPHSAVFALDAHRHLERGMGRYATAGMLLAGCAGVTFMVSRRSKSSGIRRP